MIASAISVSKGVLLLASVICALSANEVESFSVPAASPNAFPLISSTTNNRLRVPTSLQYATTVSPELPPQHASDIQKRVREIKPSTMEKKKRTTAKHGSNAATEVISMEQFQKEVMDEDDKLVVVRFFAPWCRACKAVSPVYSKFASDLAKEAPIKFVDCPLTAVDTEVHQSLGIKTIPYAHIYHPKAGLVEERRLSRKHYFNFEKVTNSYLNGECEIQMEDATIDPYPNIPVKAPAPASTPHP